MKVGVTLLVALILTGTAASGSSQGMATAMKTLHYPRSGAIKLGCRTAGAGFNCKATYRHHRVRRFYAEWRATGGFICAGAKPATCKLLRHGLVTTTLAQTAQDAAFQASRGYMTIHYQDPQPFAGSGCQSTTLPSSWSFCYALNSGSVGVTVTVKQVKAGYITTTSATVY